MERREAPGRCAAAPFGPPLRSGRPRAGYGTGLRIPPRGARAACGRFARPAARALRLPALHLRRALSARRTLLHHCNVTRDDALCEQGGSNIRALERARISIFVG